MTTVRRALTLAYDEKFRSPPPSPFPFSCPVSIRVLRIVRRGGGRAIEPPLPRVCPPPLSLFFTSPFRHSHAEGTTVCFSKGRILSLIKLQNTGIDLRKFG